MGPYLLYYIVIEIYKSFGCFQKEDILTYGRKSLGIQTLEDLRNKTADDLLACSGFGVTTLNEARDKLEYLKGLKLKDD